MLETARELWKRLKALPREALWPIATCSFVGYLAMWVMVWPLREPKTFSDWAWLMGLIVIAIFSTCVAMQLHAKEEDIRKSSFGTWWANTIMCASGAPFGFYMFLSLITTAMSLPGLLFKGELPPTWALVGMAPWILIFLLPQPKRRDSPQ